MDYESAKEELRLLILQRGIKWNTGKVHGGRRAKWIFDIREPLCTLKGSHLAAQVLFEKLKDVDFDAIGGPSIAAEPLTSAFLLYARQNGREVRGFIVRKKPNDFGLRKKVEGPIRRGDKVVIIDDILNSGASMGDSVEAMQSQGCDVAKIITLVDFCHSGIRRYENADRVFTLQDFNLEKNVLYEYEPFSGIEIKESKANQAIRSKYDCNELYQFNGDILVVHSNAVLAVFDLDGNKKWEQTLPNAPSMVRMHGHAIIIVVPFEFKRSKLYVFERDGSLKSELTFRGIISDALSIENGLLLCVGKKLIGLSNEFEQQSSLEFNEALEKIAAHGNLLYLADSDGNFVCLDPEHKKKWNLHFGNVQQISFDGGFLFLVAADYLFCIDAQRGVIQWWQPIKNQVSALHVLNGKILVGCTQGYLYEFSKNGEHVRCTKTGQMTITKIHNENDSAIITLENERQYQI